MEIEINKRYFIRQAEPDGYIEHYLIFTDQVAECDELKGADGCYGFHITFLKDGHWRFRVAEEDVICPVPKPGEVAYFWDKHPDRAKVGTFVAFNGGAFVAFNGGAGECFLVRRVGVYEAFEHWSYEKPSLSDVQTAFVEKCSCTKAGMLECLIEKAAREYGCSPVDLQIVQTMSHDFRNIIYRVEKKPKNESSSFTDKNLNPCHP